MATIEKHWKWFLLAIVLLTLALYAPLTQGNFIGVDDPKQITQNDTIKNLNWENFKTVTFTNFLNRNHNPMYASFQLNWAVTPHFFGFMMFNFVWLVAMVVLFFYFTHLFIRTKMWQLAATALFAVHSVHVDIVAWASARCHLMGMVFFLATFILWQKYRTDLGRARRLGWYLAALVTGWFAIWNKNIFFSLGLFLLLFDVYQKRCITWRFLADKLAFLAMGAVPVYILHSSTIYLKNIERPAMGGSLANTLWNDCSLLVQYLYHLIVPTPTFIWVTVYPVNSPLKTNPEASLWAMQLTPLFNLGVLLAFGAIMIWLARRQKWKLGLFFSMFSLVGLAPAMNIPPKWVEFAFRYNLILSAFFCVTLVSAMMLVSVRFKRGNIIAAVVLSLFFIGHTAQSLVQSLNWRQEKTIISSCVRNFPDAKYCQIRMARLLSWSDTPEKAIPYYKAANALSDRSTNIRRFDATYELARLYHRLGNHENALENYNRLLRINPRHAQAKSYLRMLKQTMAKEAREKKAAAAAAAGAN